MKQKQGHGVRFLAVVVQSVGLRAFYEVMGIAEGIVTSDVGWGVKAAALVGHTSIGFFFVGICVFVAFESWKQFTPRRGRSVAEVLTIAIWIGSSVLISGWIQGRWPEEYARGSLKDYVFIFALLSSIVVWFFLDRMIGRPFDADEVREFRRRDREIRYMGGMNLRGLGAFALVFCLMIGIAVCSSVAKNYVKDEAIIKWPFSVPMPAIAWVLMILMLRFVFYPSISRWVKEKACEEKGEVGEAAAGPGT